MIFLSLFLLISQSNEVFGQNIAKNQFIVEEVLSGLEYPTGIAFLGVNDILAIEKDKGTVLRIVDGEILGKPLLDVNVAVNREKYHTNEERGLLGIAVSKANENHGKTYVFLYYTEAAGNSDTDEPVGNRLYRYELVDNKLVNPKILMDLPHTPGPVHNGGVIAIGPDENVYVIVGNFYSHTFSKKPEEPNQALNAENGRTPDGRGGILRITQEGELVDDGGILGNEHPLDMYYAYGIRNSFGIAFDNITGNLWDTENGGHDEINFVKPGFNSGSSKVSGFEPRAGVNPYGDLVDFNGEGKYSPPELDLGAHVAPTAIVFLHSDRFGKSYEDDMFVGTFGGKIFHFDLSENRKELDLAGELSDKISDNFVELQETIFLDGLGIITDLEVSPDGYLYGTSYGNPGKIFKIIPKSAWYLENFLSVFRR